MQKSQPDKYCSQCTQCHGSSSLFFPIWSEYTAPLMYIFFNCNRPFSWHCWMLFLRFHPKIILSNYLETQLLCSPCRLFSLHRLWQRPIFRQKGGKGTELEIRGKVEFWIFCLLKISFQFCRKKCWVTAT